MSERIIRRGTLTPKVAAERRARHEAVADKLDARPQQSERLSLLGEAQALGLAVDVAAPLKELRAAVRNAQPTTTKEN